MVGLTAVAAVRFTIEGVRGACYKSQVCDTVLNGSGAHFRERNETGADTHTDEERGDSI